MTLGSSTDQYDPASPTLASSRYCGIARVICGTSTPASSRLKIAVRARKRYFASANPAVADTSADATPPAPSNHARTWLPAGHDPGDGVLAGRRTGPGDASPHGRAPGGTHRCSPKA